MYLCRSQPDVFQAKVDSLEREKKAEEEERVKAAADMKAEMTAAAAAPAKLKVSSVAMVTGADLINNLAIPSNM